MANQVSIQIKDKIKAKLEEITELGVVIDKPQLEFTDYPATTIVQAGIEAENNENITDERTYVFTVNVHYGFDREDINSVGYALDSAYDATDRVMDKFTLDKDWSGFQNGLEAGYSFIGLQPIVGSYEQDDNREMIIVPVTIRVDLLIPTQACS